MSVQTRQRTPGADASATGSHATPQRRSARRSLTPYLFLLPFFVVYACFMLYPILSALDISMHARSGFEAPRFVGLRNFQALFSDARFLHAMVNTALYACGTVFVLSPIALMVAVTLRSFAIPWRRLQSFYRVVLFLPNITSLVVIAIMFSFLLQPRFGMINAALGTIGIGPFNWLQSTSLVLPTIVGIAIWTYLGLNSLYFLSGLQSIPDELYEAAALDGAGRVTTFFRVTLPLLRPTIVFVVVQATIFSLQVFELPFLLTGGGPSDAGLTLGVYLYQVGFVQFNQGYASAVGWAIAAMTLLLTSAQLLVFRRFAPEA